MSDITPLACWRGKSLRTNYFSRTRIWRNLGGDSRSKNKSEAKKRLLLSYVLFFIKWLCILYTYNSDGNEVPVECIYFPYIKHYLTQGLPQRLTAIVEHTLCVLNAYLHRSFSNS